MTSKALAAATFAFSMATIPIGAETNPSLAARIEAILARPEFRHALFGIEIYSMTETRVLYALNEHKLFVPGSVTKVVTAGSVLQLLGGDFRFRTRVYRTGPITGGVLQGDLVLVASGDPNLSNRVQADDTLAFENADHAYGQIMDARLVPGDPLQVIRGLARQVSSKGVKRIAGRVLVDATLFPEGTREGGSGVVISPVSINDNVIDVIVHPGRTAGEPATLEISPITSYARFDGQVETVAAGGEARIDFVPTEAPDGSLVVKARGTLPVGSPRPFPFAVPTPSRFAQVAFVDALRQAGVSVEMPASASVDWKAMAQSYRPETVVTEHVSPPLREDVKVTLKVSQNLHAGMMPYLLGALLAGENDQALDAGFLQQRTFLERVGLDLSAAAQSDGEGGAACFTPDFLVRFLALMAEQKESAAFRDALPILGRDGSLWNTLPNSIVAGRLRAKTGTNVMGDLLNRQYVLRGKGLAGYLDAADGTRLAFAVFANHVPAGQDMKAVLAVGDALAEIAAAAYDAR